MKFAIACVLGIVLTTIILCCSRTFLLIKFKGTPVEICTIDEADGYIIADKGWEHFKKSLQFESVSYSPGVYNRQELKKLVNYVIKSKIV